MDWGGDGGGGRAAKKQKKLTACQIQVEYVAHSLAAINMSEIVDLGIKGCYNFLGAISIVTPTKR